MVALFSGKLQVFSSKPDIYGMATKLIPFARFNRSSLREAVDPTIVIDTLEYKPGMVKKSLNGWKELVKTTEETESGTLTYAVFEHGKKNCILTIEAYESVDYSDTVHANSAAVEENRKQNAHMRVGTGQRHLLKKIGGFLA